MEISTEDLQWEGFGLFFQRQGKESGKMMEHKPQAPGEHMHRWEWGEQRGARHLDWVFVHVPSTQINLARDTSNTCCKLDPKSFPSSQTRLLCWGHEGLLPPLQCSPGGPQTLSLHGALPRCCSGGRLPQQLLLLHQESRGSATAKGLRLPALLSFFFPSPEGP